MLMNYKLSEDPIRTSEKILLSRLWICYEYGKLSQYRSAETVHASDHLFTDWYHMVLGSMDE